MKLAIDQKRPELANRKGVVFQQDNVRPHTSIATRQKLRELGLEVLVHPPYSPDLASSDYHLFLSMQNFLSDKKSASRENCENRLVEFFTNRGHNFYVFFFPNLIYHGYIGNVKIDSIREKNVGRSGAASATLALFAICT